MLLAGIRFALAIILDALAFTIWDVGTRPPLRLWRDMTRGARVRRSLARGILRFVTGFALLLLAALIARPAIPSARAYTLLETGMLAVALLVEGLIGPDLRRRTRP